jgi:hypothetical protein
MASPAVQEALRRHAAYNESGFQRAQIRHPSSQHRCSPGHAVLGSDMDDDVYAAFQAFKNGFAPVDAPQLFSSVYSLLDVKDTDHRATPASAPTLEIVRRNLAAAIDAETWKHNDNAGDGHQELPRRLSKRQLLDNLPADFPCCEHLEPFIIPESDPRTYLQGQLGVRVRSDAPVLAAGTIVGLYRGRMSFQGAYNRYRLAQGLREELKFETYAASIEHWNPLYAAHTKQTRFPAMLNPSWVRGKASVPLMSSYGLIISAHGGYGNLTCLVNDPHDDPLYCYGRKTHTDANTKMIEFTVADTWAFCAMVLSQDVQPGDEILYDYGEDYWSIVRDGSDRLAVADGIDVAAPNNTTEESSGNSGCSHLQTASEGNAVAAVDLAAPSLASCENQLQNEEGAGNLFENDIALPEDGVDVLGMREHAAADDQGEAVEYVNTQPQDEIEQPDSSGGRLSMMTPRKRLRACVNIKNGGALRGGADCSAESSDRIADYEAAELEREAASLAYNRANKRLTACVAKALGCRDRYPAHADSVVNHPVWMFAVNHPPHGWPLGTGPFSLTDLDFVRTIYCQIGNAVRLRYHPDADSAHTAAFRPCPPDGRSLSEILHNYGGAALDASVARRLKEHATEERRQSRLRLDEATAWYENAKKNLEEAMSDGMVVALEEDADRHVMENGEHDSDGSGQRRNVVRRKRCKLGPQAAQHSTAAGVGVESQLLLSPIRAGTGCDGLQQGAQEPGRESQRERDSQWIAPITLHGIASADVIGVLSKGVENEVIDLTMDG